MTLFMSGAVIRKQRGIYPDAVNNIKKLTRYGLALEATDLGELLRQLCRSREKV